MLEACRRRLVGAVCFAQAAHRYWWRAFPQARAELHAWRKHAARIPDVQLRTAALCALDTKRCDLEGAIGFAAMFANEANLNHAVRAITSFQLVFDYLDCIVETPNPDPVTNSQSLHRALSVALTAGDDHHDYYEHQSSSDDAGYLRLLVDSCRQATTRLPAFSVTDVPMRRALERIITYQSLSHGTDGASQTSFLCWAQSQSVPGTEMWWWETGAATGSQLAVLALIAAAADPDTDREHAQAIEGAYFPWVGALSTLLDSVVDRDRDRVECRPSLLDHYSSSQQMSDRMKLMATEATHAVNPLANAYRHRILLAAMGAFFHSRPENRRSEAYQITQAIVEALGAWTIPAKMVLRVRRAVGEGNRRRDIPQPAPKYK